MAKFIDLNGQFSVRISSIKAFCLLPEDSRKVKVEYSNNSTCTISHATERDAMNMYTKLKDAVENGED